MALYRCGGSRLQNKTVNSSTVSQVITADSGYTGLKQVTINPITYSESNPRLSIAKLTAKAYCEVAGIDYAWNGDAELTFDTKNDTTLCIDLTNFGSATRANLNVYGNDSSVLLSCSPIDSSNKKKYYIDISNYYSIKILLRTERHDTAGGNISATIHSIKVW